MNDIQEQIVSRSQTALNEISSVTTLQDLDQIRVAVLGKKGSLSEALKTLGTVPPAERPKIGALANEWKAKIEGALETKKSELEAKEIEASLAKTKIDITLPSRRPHVGSLHPITKTIQKVSEVLGRIGFDVTIGPEAETDFLNFEAANIPKDHPARDMQDTFFLGPGVVLRSHTTAVQMRAMRSKLGRSAFSARARSIAVTATQPTRRCSIRSKGSGSTRRFR